MLRQAADAHLERDTMAWDGSARAKRPSADRANPCGSERPVLDYRYGVRVAYRCRVLVDSDHRPQLAIDGRIPPWVVGRLPTRLRLSCVARDFPKADYHNGRADRVQHVEFCVMFLKLIEDDHVWWIKRTMESEAIFCSWIEDFLLVLS